MGATCLKAGTHGHRGTRSRRAEALGRPPGREPLSEGAPHVEFLEQ